MSTRTSATLPGEATSAGAARKFTARVLGEAGVGAGVLDAAVLIASELVANAVVHSMSGQGGKVRLTVVVMAGQWVQVECRDDGPLPGTAPLRAFPAAPPAADREGARGLYLVAALSMNSGLDGRGLFWSRLAWDAAAPAEDDGALFPMPAGGAW
jgi:anti-sigma regulatory factor (Ser/Thr protein kinase)